VYEGGIRVAAAVRWPAGGLSGGKVCAEPIGYIDVLPTLMRVAGAKAEAGDKPLDGLDVLGVMRGEKSVPERPWFSYIAQGETGQAAVTLGDWKLVAKGADVLAAGKGVTLELYDLAADPKESKDLAAERPEKVEELRRRLVEFGKLEPAERVAPYGQGRRGFKAPKDWVVR
jgi:arylsulfatase B